MNSIMQEYYGMFELYQRVRSALMDVLTDEELAFSPGGENPPLGELCLEIGEVEQSYIDSFKTFTLNFDYRQPDRSLAGSVARLQEWYRELDGALKEVVAGLSEDDIQHKTIDRGGNFVLPPRVQLAVYQEALLIFYGKAAVYLKAMGKPRPEQMAHWIG